MRQLLTLVVTLGLAAAALAQTARSSTASPLNMERYEGTSVVTDLGFNIRLNRDSGLRREWFVIRDSSSPAAIEGSSGVAVVFKSGDRGTSGSYEYKVAYRFAPREAISAFEVRAVVLDVFGRLVKTLSTTELVDLSEARLFEARWRIWSENEASEAFASIVYVAQVRTAAGRVYEVDRTAVFDQVRRVSRRLTEADLEPPRREPPSR